MVDYGGVLYHPNYLILCERARGQALKEAGYSFEEMLKDGFATPLKENRSRYFKPVYLGDELVVLTTLKNAKGVTLEIEQVILYAKDYLNTAESNFIDNDSVLIEEKSIIYKLEVTLVSVKLNPIKPTRFPERLAAAIAQ
jgi:YbgC/YbaW family acyl-CoA thioester hydrolase